jgi:hypothetical protein
VPIAIPNFRWRTVIQILAQIDLATRDDGCGTDSRNVSSLTNPVVATLSE